MAETCSLPNSKKLTSSCHQVEEELETPAATPNLAVSVSASFPNAEVFGVKLINGHATQAVLDFTNNEAEPIQVALIGGALSSLQPLAPDIHPSAAIVRNITATRYDVEIPAGEKQTLPYTFTTDLHPQDLRLNLIAVVSSRAGDVYQVQAYNETVSVVEAATSIFDPQMFDPHLPNENSVLIRLQHLPVPLPPCRLRRNPILRIQDLDRDSLPTNQTRRKGWRACQAFIRWIQEGCGPRGPSLRHWRGWTSRYYWC
jgi:hypothetical protein